MYNTLVTAGAFGAIILLSTLTILPAHIIDGDLVWGKEFFKWMMLLGLISSLASVFFKKSDPAEISRTLLGMLVFGLAFWSLYAELPPNDPISFAAKSLLALTGYVCSLMILILFPVLFKQR